MMLFSPFANIECLFFAEKARDHLKRCRYSCSQISKIVLIIHIHANLWKILTLARLIILPFLLIVYVIAGFYKKHRRNRIYSTISHNVKEILFNIIRLVNASILLHYI
ncbi:hypothetical protein D3C80_1203110 [compost metagenome]